VVLGRKEKPTGAAGKQGKSKTHCKAPRAGVANDKFERMKEDSNTAEIEPLRGAGWSTRKKTKKPKKAKGRS